jgi:hypothetical protein
LEIKRKDISEDAIAKNQTARRSTVNAFSRVLIALISANVRSARTLRERNQTLLK